MLILKNPHWIKEMSVRWIALRLVYARFKQIERGLLDRYFRDIWEQSKSR